MWQYLYVLVHIQRCYMQWYPYVLVHIYRCWCYMQWYLYVLVCIYKCNMQVWLCYPYKLHESHFYCKGFEKFPQVQKIAQSGHTVGIQTWDLSTMVGADKTRKLLGGIGQKKDKANVQWLWEGTHFPKVMSSNPGTIHWMDIFHIPICCKNCRYCCLKRQK